jgi:uncharacterized membrane protein
MLPLFNKKTFFNALEEKQIMASIRHAENASSGEIRLYVESHCKTATPERAIEVFKKLKMHRTRERNAVLLYIAMGDHKFAIFGDDGIHQKMGIRFWEAEAATLKVFFQKGEIIAGLCQVIEDIGQTLKTHFPHPPDDKNELSDKPVYGR